MIEFSYFICHIKSLPRKVSITKKVTKKDPFSAGEAKATLTEKVFSFYDFVLSYVKHKPLRLLNHIPHKKTFPIAPGLHIHNMFAVDIFLCRLILNLCLALSLSLYTPSSTCSKPFALACLRAICIIKLPSPILVYICLIDIPR